MVPSRSDSHPTQSPILSLSPFPFQFQDQDHLNWIQSEKEQSWRAASAGFGPWAFVGRLNAVGLPPPSRSAALTLLEEDYRKVQIIQRVLIGVEKEQLISNMKERRVWPGLVRPQRVASRPLQSSPPLHPFL